MRNKVWCVFEVVEYEGAYLIGIAQTVEGAEQIKVADQKRRGDDNAERGWWQKSAEYDVAEWEVQP